MTRTYPKGSHVGHRPIADLIQLELDMLGIHTHDANATEALQYARRLDALPEDPDQTDPHVVHALVHKLNERMLALQQPYWRAGSTPMPTLLQEVMHERAAAVHARVPRHVRRAPFPNSHPEAITLSDGQPTTRQRHHWWPGMVSDENKSIRI